MMENSQQEWKYFAFISYSRKDSGAAKWLQKRLEWFRFPVKLVAISDRPLHPNYIRPVYRDKTNLEVDSKHYWENIQTAIKQSRFLIVLCSPDSAASTPVDKEVRYFIENREDPIPSILAVILRGSVSSKDKTLCCLCPALLELGDIITGRNLPSMIQDEGDREKEGWENGFLGILSYLLRIPRGLIADHLSREQRKKVARTRLIAASMALLAAVALVSGWIARTQRNKAVTTRDEAEDVIRFLIDFSGQPTKGITMTEMREKVLERASQYYINLGINENNPHQIRNKAVALTNLGDSYRWSNGLEKAEELYQAALELDLMQLKLDPTNPESKHNLAFSYSRLGSLWAARGDTIKSTQLLEKALTLRRQAVAARPENTEWKYRLAELLKEMRKHHEALDISKQLVDEEPDALKWRQLHALILLSTAEFIFKNDGDSKQAMLNAKEAILIYRDIQSIDPRNPEYLQALTEGLNTKGNILLDLLDTSSATACFEESVAIQRGLVEQDDRNQIFKRNLGRYLYSLGRAYRLEKRLNDGIEVGDESLSLFLNLVEQLPNDVEIKRQLAVAAGNMGDLYYLINKNEMALNQFGFAVSVFREIKDADAANILAKQDLRVALVKSAWNFSQIYNWIDAEVSYREALNIAMELQAHDPKRIEYKRGVYIALHGLSTSLMNQNKIEMAYPLAKDLVKITEELTGADVDNKQFRSDYIESIFVLGKAEKMMGNSHTARIHFQNSLRELRALELIDPSPRTQALLSQIQKSLNDQSDQIETTAKILDESPFLELIRNKHKLPGLSTVVMKDGRIVASGASGVRRIDHNSQLRFDDRVNLGSLTKLLTVAVAARLVDRGMIRWDTRVRDVFPEKSSIHPEFSGVTLDELLAHRGGVHEMRVFYQNHQKRLDALSANESVSEWRREICLWVLQDEPQIKKGNFLYSNLGYTVAAGMLEITSGKSWEELIREEVFEVIGMSSADLGVSYDASQVPIGPVGHTTIFGGIQPIPNEPVSSAVTKKDQALLGAGGFLMCTLEDYAKFLTVMIGRNGTYISRSSSQQIFGRWIETESYGRGVHILERNWALPSMALNHNGEIFGQSSVFWCSPEKNFVAITYTNSDKKNGKAILGLDEISAKMTLHYSGDSRDLEHQLPSK